MSYLLGNNAMKKIINDNNNARYQGRYENRSVKTTISDTINNSDFNIEDSLIDSILNCISINTSIDRKVIKKIIGGQGTNRLQRVVSCLQRYKKSGANITKDIMAVAVLAVTEDKFLNELLRITPKKVPFMKRDHKSLKY